MKTVLDEYELWHAINMIISNTTSANTGKSIGVVTRIQKRFVKLGLEKPLYIGCQHHVVDAILKHVTGDFFDGATRLSYQIHAQFNIRFINFSFLG